MLILLLLISGGLCNYTLTSHVYSEKIGEYMGKELIACRCSNSSLCGENCDKLNISREEVMRCLKKKYILR